MLSAIIYIIIIGTVDINTINCLLQQLSTTWKAKLISDVHIFRYCRWLKWKSIIQY